MSLLHHLALSCLNCSPEATGCLGPHLTPDGRKSNAPFPLDTSPSGGRVEAPKAFMSVRAQSSFASRCPSPQQYALHSCRSSEAEGDAREWRGMWKEGRGPTGGSQACRGNVHTKGSVANPRMHPSIVWVTVPPVRQPLVLSDWSVAQRPFADCALDVRGFGIHFSALLMPSEPLSLLPSKGHARHPCTQTLTRSARVQFTHRDRGLWPPTAFPPCRR